jgi:predicted lipoprotein
VKGKAKKNQPRIFTGCTVFLEAHGAMKLSLSGAGAEVHVAVGPALHATGSARIEAALRDALRCSREMFERQP